MSISKIRVENKRVCFDFQLAREKKAKWAIGGIITLHLHHYDGNLTLIRSEKIYIFNSDFNKTRKLTENVSSSSHEPKAVFFRLDFGATELQTGFILIPRD